MLIFISVLLIMIIVLGLGWWTAWWIMRLTTKQYILKLSKPITDNIITAIEKGLAVASDEQRRLSQFEINSIRGAIGMTLKKELEGQIKKIVPWLLFWFYIGGIALFTITIFVLFHQSSLQEILIYIFQGECN